jgi:hypothetical protein
MPKTAAQRQKDRRERRKHGARIERVVVKPGEFLVVMNASDAADTLCDLGLIGQWDSENDALIRAVLISELRRLGVTV